MNPSNNEPSFELPIPQTGPSEMAGPSTPEQLPSTEQPKGPSVPARQPVSIPAPYPTVANATDQSIAAQPQLSTPLVADDNDLIEKEWVIKAKQIVAATKHDPFVQNKELNRFKADYLKKRYNKDIKVEDVQ